jgi:hypothetical protein
LERLAYVDVFLRTQHQRIGRAEEHTGFSHFYIHEPQRQVEDTEAELNNLSNLSRSASSVLVGLADMMQHLQASTILLEAILSSDFTAGIHGVELMVRREIEIKDIARLLNPQLKQRYGYINYIKERAQNQVTVVGFPQSN